MLYPSYTPDEMHLIALFSSQKGMRNIDDLLERHREKIDSQRDETKAMILLLVGKNPEEVRPLVPKIPGPHWKYLLYPVFTELEKMASARRLETRSRRKQTQLIPA